MAPRSGLLNIDMFYGARSPRDRMHTLEPDKMRSAVMGHGSVDRAEGGWR